MKIVCPTGNTKITELKIPASVKKAFNTYYKNAKVVDADNESLDIDILMISYLATFAESQEFKDMSDEAELVKQEAKEMRERAKAEKEVRKQARLAEAEAKKQAKIQKLQEEIKKLEND